MKTEPYNPLDYLETQDEVIEYLNDAYLDDDPRMFMIALGYVAKAQGVTEVARKSGLNRESLYKVFSGQSKPQWNTVQSILKALNIHLKAVSA